MTPKDTHRGPANGCYLGRTGFYFIEFRLDLRPDGTGLISADLQSGADGSWVSLNLPDNSPAPRLDGQGFAVQVTAKDPDKPTTALVRGPGQLVLTPGSTPDRIGFTLTVDGKVGPVPAGSVVTAELVYDSATFRQLAVEVDAQIGLNVPTIVNFDPAASPRSGQDPREQTAPPVDGVEYFRRAGFAVTTTGQRDGVKPTEDDWSTPDVVEALTKLIRRTAQAPLDQPVWQQHVLLLSRSPNDGLRGINIDLSEGGTRQGVAVFVDAIRDQYPDWLGDRAILKTVMHELGHGLNLPHRFGRPARRSNSCSPMNYDWRYSGPGQVPGYWEEYREEFDPDELDALHHGTRFEIIPGGLPLGSSPAWVEREQGPLSDPVEVTNSLRLWLTPPPSGTNFAVREPIWLTVTARNDGTDPVDLPRHCLDIKAGVLEITAQMSETLLPGQNPDAGPTDSEPVATTTCLPMLRRCYTIGKAGTILLGPGESLHTNANLTYGGGGFTFPAAGHYELTPMLTIPATSVTALDEIVVGETLAIDVSDGASPGELKVLGRADVAAALVLGSRPADIEAADDLASLRALRSDQSPVGAGDPLVAWIARAAGIAHGRKNEFTAAVRELETALAEGGGTFDPHTAEHTQRLLQRYRAQDNRPAEPVPTVVVDLRADVPGGDPEGGRVAGLMITDNGSPDEPFADCWAVIAPADQLPSSALADESEIYAEVFVTAVDGLTEHVRVTDVVLVQGPEEDSGPLLAHLRLARQVPVAPTPPPAQVPADATVWQWVGGLSADSRQAADLLTVRGDTSRPWTRTVDQSLANAPSEGRPPVAVASVLRRRLNDADRRDWTCIFKRDCEPGSPWPHHWRRPPAPRSGLRLSAWPLPGSTAPTTDRSTQEKTDPPPEAKTGRTEDEQSSSAPLEKSEYPDDNADGRAT